MWGLWKSSIYTGYLGKNTDIKSKVVSDIFFINTKVLRASAWQINQHLEPVKQL